MKFSRQELKTHLLPILLAQGFGFACGIIGVKVTSQFVSPTDLGRYGVLLTFTTTGAMIVHAGLIKYVSRHWAGEQNRPAMLVGVIKSWWSKLPWLLLPAIGGGLVVGNLPAVFGIFAAAALLALFALTQAALQATRENWRDGGVVVGASLTRTFAPLLLYLSTGGQWFGLWLGFVGHALTAAAGSIWALRRHWRGHLAATPIIKPATIYTGALFVTLAITAWTLNGLTRWLVAAGFGVETAGYYTLASNIGLIIPTMIGGIFIQYQQPVLFAHADQSDTTPRKLIRFVDRMTLAYTALTLLGLALLYWVAPRLVGPLIDPVYLPALPWILPAGCFGISIIAGQFYHTVLLAGRRETACGPVDLITAGVLVVGCCVSALLGEDQFRVWLVCSILVPWVIKRPLARRALLKTVASREPAPDQ